MEANRADESGRHVAAWSVLPVSWRTSAEDAPLATVFTEGSTHRVRHANAAFCALTQKRRAVVLNRPLDALLPADTRGEASPPVRLRALLDRVFETGIPNVVSDVAWRDPPTGEILRYFTAIASPILSEHSGERGLLVQVLDTTEHVMARAAEERVARDARMANEALVLTGLREHEMAEAALREKQRWNALVENLAEGITILDASGHTILVNPVGRRLLDLEALGTREYSECTFHDLKGVELPPERHPARRALAGESFVDEELSHYRADGSRCRLLFSGSCVRDDAGEEVVLAINAYRDVTGLRKLEEMREEYVALISHDLRNPLHTLLLNSQLLIEKLDSEGKDILVPEGRYARAIEKGTRRLAAMVDELYQSSQLEAGNAHLRLEPVAPAALVTNLLGELGSPRERERVILNVTAHELPVLLIDTVKLERALMNLVNNALKYSQPGSIVTVELTATAREVIFTVRDRGPGIAPEDLPHVFEKYHRGRVTFDREGMGLGLYITRRIVEAHGGRISVESVPGRGTTFRIALPIGASLTPRGT